MADPEVNAPRFCSQCGKPIVITGAKFCKDCGAVLGYRFPIAHDVSWEPLVAAALSVIPGLGHLYRRHPGRAALWFFGVVFAYGISYPLGLMLQLVCAANAALSGMTRHDTTASRLRGGNG